MAANPATIVGRDVRPGLRPRGSAGQLMAAGLDTWGRHDRSVGGRVSGAPALELRADRPPRPRERDGAPARLAEVLAHARRAADGACHGQRYEHVQPRRPGRELPRAEPAVLSGVARPP